MGLHCSCGDTDSSGEKNLAVSTGKHSNILLKGKEVSIMVFKSRVRKCQNT